MLSARSKGELTMCDHTACTHDMTMTRRGFAGLAAGAGLALLPLRARASGAIQAMGVSCIDYRLVDDAVRFFGKLGLANEYDALSLAGASLAAVSPKFPSSNKAFWDQLAIARDLHHIRKVVVVDHRDCGAYKVAFGKNFQGEGAAETAQHRQVMLAAKNAILQMQPELETEFYLMALDGKAERIV